MSAGDQVARDLRLGRERVANALPCGTCVMARRASITFFQEGGDTIVQVDVNGDATADFSVQLKGLRALTATSFCKQTQVPGGGPSRLYHLKRGLRFRQAQKTDGQARVIPGPPRFQTRHQTARRISMSQP